MWPPLIRLKRDEVIAELLAVEKRADGHEP